MHKYVVRKCLKISSLEDLILISSIGKNKLKSTRGGEIGLLINIKTIY